MVRGTGQDCSGGADKRRRDGARGPASRRGGKNVCVNEYKREIKGGGSQTKRGLWGFCLIKYVPMFV